MNKITRTDPKEYAKFSTISFGNVFFSRQSTYIKINPYKDLEHIGNAVMLETGATAYFNEEDFVTTLTSVLIAP